MREDETKRLTGSYWLLLEAKQAAHNRVLQDDNPTNRKEFRKHQGAVKHTRPIGRGGAMGAYAHPHLPKDN